MFFSYLPVKILKQHSEKDWLFLLKYPLPENILYFDFYHSAYPIPDG